MLCPLYTGLWCLMRGSVYAMSTIYRALWPDGRGGGGFVYALSTIYRAVVPDEGSVYAMSTIYRAMGPDEGVCICYVHYIQGCGV